MMVNMMLVRLSYDYPAILLVHWCRQVAGAPTNVFIICNTKDDKRKKYWSSYDDLAYGFVRILVVVSLQELLRSLYHMHA